jgi:hypothetical protein
MYVTVPVPVLVCICMYSAVTIRQPKSVRKNRYCSPPHCICIYSAYNRYISQSLGKVSGRKKTQVLFSYLFFSSNVGEGAGVVCPVLK